MEKNKRKIKPPVELQRGAKIRNPQFEQVKRETQLREARKKAKQKKYRGRIKAGLAAGIIGLGAVSVIIKEILEDLTETECKYTIVKVSSTEQNKAVINANGMAYELDEGSFALVEGKIQEGENIVHGYDNSGKLLEGIVEEEFLEEILVMSEKELEKYDMIYRVMPDEGAGIRTSATSEVNNIIYTANYGDYVLGSTTSNEEQWIEVLSTNGEDIFQGYIEEADLGLVRILSASEYQRQDEDNARMVDTSKEDYNNLHLRMGPKMGRNVITIIPHGSVVHIIGETVIADSREWTEIEYLDTSGARLKGWVATEYLKEFEREEQEEKIHNFEINASGNVTGIDISGISPDALRELLQTGMPESVTTSTYGVTDTSQVAGKINFVFIKLGASPYGKGEFRTLEYNGYEEQVKVCEELGVPYGFYYYSSAINEREARLEAEYIRQSIKDLREKYNMKYNILPMTVDIELTDENDRQYGENIEELSDVKAYLINSIQEDGISERVLIYAPGRVMDPEDSDRLIDLERIKEKISEPDDLAIWLCAPIKTNGETTSRTEKYYDLIENKFGVKIVNRQIALDATTSLNSKEKMDVNNMEFEYFHELLAQHEITAQIETSSGYSLIELIEKVQDDER